MRRIFRLFAIETVALYLATQIATGMVFEKELEGLVITGIALALAMRLVKPFINVLLLPLTLATLGLLKFLGSTVTLYIVDYALPQFEVTGFHFSGLTSDYLDLPAVSFDNKIFGYLAFALIISIITSLINWIRK